MTTATRAKTIWRISTLMLDDLDSTIVSCLRTILLCSNNAISRWTNSRSTLQSLTFFALRLQTSASSSIVSKLMILKRKWLKQKRWKRIHLSFQRATKALKLPAAKLLRDKLMLAKKQDSLCIASAKSTSTSQVVLPTAEETLKKSNWW